MTDYERLGTICYRRLKNWVLWVRQGKPRIVPVVVKPGKIVVCQHGSSLVQGWHWHMDYLRVPTEDGIGIIDGGHLVDVLGAQYGMTRVKELDQCPDCHSYVTV